MRGHKTLVALVFFCIVLAYTTWLRKEQQEGFQDTSAAAASQDIQKFLQQIQGATGQLGEAKAYQDWIGWVYAHPETAANALNDFKKRVFQPDCSFRMNWDTDLPNGLLRPTPAENADLANIAYRSYLNCLAKGDIKCVSLLDDARVRFMEPSCGLQMHEDRSAYNRNVESVFPQIQSAK